MNRTGYLFAAAVAFSATLAAQVQPGITSFQRAQSLVDPSAAAGGRGGRGINVMPLPRAETGKPFSATVTTQTTQTLLDGTHVKQTTVTLEYRDAEGRTRTEIPESGAAISGLARSVVIRDPVAQVTYRLDPATKTGVTIPSSGAAGAPAAALPGGRGARGGRGGNNPNQRIEDLGTTTVNGVPAIGTRVITVVPLGAIGNDREFRSITERWFSTDLNLLIKSVSTDPRFGTTTYELTNISRQAPDPSLFRPPAIYAMTPQAEPQRMAADGARQAAVRRSINQAMQAR